MGRILICLAIITFFTSCKKDFLQRDTGVPLSEENIFADPLLASGFADNSYNYLIDDFGHLQAPGLVKGTTGQLTDEAVGSTAGDFFPFLNVMNQGNFLDANATDVNVIYARMYSGIRNANKMLAKISSVPWTSAYNAQLVRAQQLFLRAFFYFELVKRFGGVIILDKALTLDENPDLPRNSYAETVAFILKDLAEAEQILTTENFTSINGTSYSVSAGWNAGNYGRPTVGAVKALRSRLLLLDASPQFNTTGDAAKWKAAANAAKEIINMGQYSLFPAYSSVLATGGTSNNGEYILIKVRAPRSISGFLDDFIIPPSSGGKQSMLYPTQNHVDLYEMSNGKPITDPTSGYNLQDPYKNRDPRFYANLIYNGQTWQGRTIQMWSQTVGGVTTYGTDYQPTSNAYTATRYYCQKLWPAVYRGGATARSVLNFVFFRYAEILLNYAEALNEADGPVADVYTSINQVRTRAGMPNLPAGLTMDQMRARIHNERAVELAFEEFRWWDILRWKEGPTLIPKTINAMNVQRNGTTFVYSVVPMAAAYQRKFEERNNLYPIPRNEIVKSNGILQQNPGW